MRKPALRFVRREPPRPPEPGFWLVYLKRGARHVPARIWLCDHEPYNVENKLDRWPIPFLAAEIAGRWVEVWQVWDHVCLMTENPQHWRAAVPIEPRDGLTIEEEYAYQMSLLDWRQQNEGVSPTKPIRRLTELELPF